MQLMFSASATAIDAFQSSFPDHNPSPDDGALLHQFFAEESRRAEDEGMMFSDYGIPRARTTAA